MAGVLAYSLEFFPTLFTVRLFDDTGSVLVISDVAFTVTLSNGVQYTGSTSNGKIEIGWYNVDNIQIDEGDCWEAVNIPISFSDYTNQFKDILLVIKPCISDLGVNQGNYYTWFSLQGTDLSDLNVPLCSARLKECFGADISKAGIVNPYIKNPNTKHHPIVTPFEETTFYINFDVPIDSGVVNDFELGIMDEYFNLIIPSIGTIQKHIVNIDNDYVYFGTDIRPEKDDLVPCNLYRFVIYDKSTDVLLYISNPWRFLTEDVTEKSTYLEYRSSTSIFNFDYTGLPSYVNKVRLKLYNIGLGSESESEQYRSATTGTVRNFESVLDKFFVIETYWFDELAEVATMVLNEHDDIKMNAVEYTIKTKWQPEDNVFSRVKKGTFEVIEKQFSEINRFC